MTTSPLKYAFIPRVDTRLGWDLAKLLHKQGYRIVAHTQTQARQEFISTQLRKHIPEIELTCYYANLSSAQEVFWLTSLLTKNIPHLDCVVWPLASLSQCKSKDEHYQENVDAFYLLLCGLVRHRKSDSMQIIQIASSGTNWLQPLARITKHSSDIKRHSNLNTDVFTHFQQRYASQKTVAGYVISAPYIKQTEDLVISQLNSKATWWQQIFRAAEATLLTKVTTAIEDILAHQPTANDVYSYQFCYSSLRRPGRLIPIAVDHKSAKKTIDDLYTKLRID